MTRKRALKQMIRERMDRTGERYTTARVNVLADRGRPATAGLLRSVEVVGGVQPDLSAARNICAHNGVTGPDGKPLTEAMAFGLAGGIGFLHGTFVYGCDPTMIIVARNDSMPDPMVDTLLARAGLQVALSTTTSRAKAERLLDDALEREQPALITVGAGCLPHLGLPPEEAAMSPHVVGVVGRDGDRLLLDDRAPDPIPIERSHLDTARATYRKARHRSITVEPGTPVEWPVALWAAVAENAVSFDTPPVPQFAANVGIAGMTRLANLLRSSSARSWSRLFDRDRKAAIALTRLGECVDHAYTSPAAGRPLYAAFLREAAGIADRPDWSTTADRLAEAAELWRELTAIARGAHPDIAAHADLADHRAAELDSGAEAEAMVELGHRQRALVEGCRLEPDTAAAVYRDLATVIDRIVELERSVLDQLKRRPGQ